MIRLEITQEFKDVVNVQELNVDKNLRHIVKIAIVQYEMIQIRIPPGYKLIVRSLYILMHEEPFWWP